MISDLVGVTERVLAEPGACRRPTSTPALISLAWMSPDWARASRLTRSLTAAASTVTPSRPAEWIPNSLVVAVAGHHLGAGDEGLGRDAVGEHAGAAGPSASTRVTSASSCAATSAASYPAGPPPMITIRLTTSASAMLTVTFVPHDVPTRTVVFSTTAVPGYRHRRASLRRVRLEPRPRPHAGLLPALADGRHRVARRLAPDLRR